MTNPFKALASSYRQRSVDNLFQLDGAAPISKGIPFGAQHVLALFVSNIAPILLLFASIGTAPADVVDNAIRGAAFLAAIGTAIQLFPIWRVGSKMPLYMGTSFTFIGVLSLVGSRYNLSTMFISVIVGSLIAGILGLFAGKWKKAIKPIVPAMVVLGLGLSLLSVGAKDFLAIDVTGVLGPQGYDFGNAWPHLLVAAITLVSGIIWQVLVKGVWKNIGILVGLIAGYLAALCFIPYNGMVDFSAFRFNSVTDFIDVPRPFFTLTSASWGDFHFGSILVVTIVCLVTSIENLGNISSLSAISFEREPTDRELSGGIAATGFIGALAGFFGALPLTGYGQNVGIVGQTKVINRMALLTGPIILLLASMFPPISRLLLTIPTAVLGGTVIMLFASICLIGIQMLAKLGFTKKNIMIASLCLGLGYGVSLVTEFTGTRFEVDAVNYVMLLVGNPVVSMFLISFILSYLIPESFNEEIKPKV